jgi:hypothetical protein
MYVDSMMQAVPIVYDGETARPLVSREEVGVVFDLTVGYVGDAIAESGVRGLSAINRASKAKVLYRGERSTMSPDVVFENGFAPKGRHNDALLHTKSNTTAGNFISTTDKFELARDGFAGKNGYVYVIETNNYVDINVTYGGKAYFPQQFEFSIPGGINPSQIKGAYAKQSGKIVGDFIPNPNYGGY